MYCPSCGKEIPDGDHFCQYCGESLVSFAASLDASASETEQAASALPETELLSETGGPGGFEQYYHWANLIGIPVLSLLLLTGEESFMYIWMAAIVTSSLLNKRLRGWVVRALVAIFGSAAYVGCLGLGLVGIMLLIPLALGATAFLFVAAAYLWISSLITLAQKTQMQGDARR